MIGQLFYMHRQNTIKFLGRHPGFIKWVLAIGGSVVFTHFVDNDKTLVLLPLWFIGARLILPTLKNKIKPGSIMIPSIILALLALLLVLITLPWDIEHIKNNSIYKIIPICFSMVAIITLLDDI
jgi:hypothetical protein